MSAFLLLVYRPWRETHMLEFCASLGTIVNNRSRLMCPDIFSPFSKKFRQTQAIDDILLLHSKWCNPQYRYLKKRKRQCVFQAIRLHHWVFWLCNRLEAISQLHSHCKLVYLLLVHNSESQWNEIMGNHVLNVFKASQKGDSLLSLFRHTNMENCSWMAFVLHAFFLVVFKNSQNFPPKLTSSLFDMEYNIEAFINEEMILKIFSLMLKTKF